MSNAWLWPFLILGWPSCVPAIRLYRKSFHPTLHFSRVSPSDGQLLPVFVDIDECAKNTHKCGACYEQKNG